MNIDTHNDKLEKVAPMALYELIISLPDEEDHIYAEGGKMCVTQEWLCGGFAGRSFEAPTLKEALQEMIDYFYEHIGHDSIVGKCVTDSGFPDLKKVKEYCLKEKL
jgi:hypothetical protein